MFSSLLVPLDGSPLAEEALHYGFLLAERLGSKLVLLQVRSAAEGKAEGGPVSAYLNGVQRQAAARGISTRAVEANGRPAEAILDTAASSRCDLIAMSTHGRSGLTRWVLGSVTDRVVHAAAVPVLLVRPSDKHGAGAATPVLKRVIVPLDGSSLAEAALPVAERLARALGVGLVLVQAVDPRVFSYLGPEIGLSYQNIHAVLERTAKDYLALLAAGCAKAGLEVEYKVLHGLPAESISDAARMNAGSLVVISSHGRSGLTRWALGSVTEKVVRDSEAPVLVLRSKAAAALASDDGSRAAAAKGNAQR
jgi:nucleotide-binding universal stress UspA family protein